MSGAVGERLGAHAAVLGGLAALLAAGALGLAGLAATLGAGAGSGQGALAVDGGLEYAITSRAIADIPQPYLRLYVSAARRYGLDWAVLAAIGKVECDHGRDPDPSCTREGAVNSAGAGGPAQFLAATWSVYGVSASDSGVPDRWNPADAILGMANYLRASGAPANYRRAIYAYNHAWWYVAEVERWAAIYRGRTRSRVGAGGSVGSGTASAGLGGASAGSGAASAGSGGASVESGSASLRSAGVGAGGTSSEPVRDGTATVAVQTIPGERAELSPRDGHLAFVPQGVPPAVQALVVAGNELQDLPYGAAGHPDPLGAISEDCSSTVNYVLYRAGVRALAEILRDDPLAQDYVDWGAPGPGRWVTIYATRVPTAHVFIVIAGLRLDTSHDGTDVGPNRDQDGPRWRILDHIPTWAHWSVRHPPGL